MFAGRKRLSTMGTRFLVSSCGSRSDRDDTVSFKETRLVLQDVRGVARAWRCAGRGNGGQGIKFEPSYG